jgi:hypothetical protein
MDSRGASAGELVHHRQGSTIESIITTPPSRNRSEFLDETHATAVSSLTQPTLVSWLWIGEGHVGANI